MPQIRTLTGKTPLERLEQSLQTNNDQYSQGREQEISLSQQLQQRAKQRKEEGFVQQGVSSLLEQAMTPNEKGEMMDEPTLRSKVFNTGLKLLLGGGETGKSVVPILDKLLTSTYPEKKSGLSFDQQKQLAVLRGGMKNPNDWEEYNTVAKALWDADPKIKEKYKSPEEYAIARRSEQKMKEIEAGVAGKVEVKKTIPGGTGKSRKDQDPEEATRHAGELYQQIKSTYVDDKGNFTLDLNGILAGTKPIPKEKKAVTNKITRKTELVEGSKPDPLILKWVAAEKRKDELTGEGYIKSLEQSKQTTTQKPKW